VQILLPQGSVKDLRCILVSFIVVDINVVVQSFVLVHAFLHCLQV